METRSVQTQYCHPLPQQCQRTVSERSVPSPPRLGTTDWPILHDFAHLQHWGSAGCPPLASVSSFSGALFSKGIECFSHFKTFQTAHVLCLLKMRARLIIAQFLVSFCQSGFLGEGGVPPLCDEDQAVLPEEAEQTSLFLCFPGGGGVCVPRRVGLAWLVV